MAPDLLALFTITTAALIVGVLTTRGRDQRRRDATRHVVVLSFPRGVRLEQVVAVVRAIVGLATAGWGLRGRPSVALEVVGRRRGINFRLRLPEAASTYLIAQLRGAIPGLAVTEVDEFVAERCRVAVELRRRVTTGDLAVNDAVAVSRTILGAAMGLAKDEVTVWAIVVAGGISARPAERPPWWRFIQGAESTEARRRDTGVVGITLRLGAVAGTDRRARELVARLRRAAGSVSSPKARLVPRWLPNWLVVSRLERAATPITAWLILLLIEELAALIGWPIGSPLLPGVSLGGSPQLPAAATVPGRGRVLGRSTADGRRVAQPLRGATEHMIIIGPTGSGKTYLAVRLLVDDITAGRGALYLTPKPQNAELLLSHLPASAIGRTVVVDPAREIELPVPLPLLASETGDRVELPGDTLVALLEHRFGNLGPRSTDILSSSLYALARFPGATIADLLRLWGDDRFRAEVAGRVQGDLALRTFFAWYGSLSAPERAVVTAPAQNKIRPLLQGSVRNVVAAPRSTFSFSEAMRDRLVVVVALDEGKLGRLVVDLLGQVVFERAWSAVQARRESSFFNVTIDEAPRFLDVPNDLGDAFARSREFGVGITAIGQSLGMFPPDLREVAMSSARTKIAFGTSSADARRLANEFGPSVEADYFTGLDRYEAIAQVSLGGTVSQPFTVKTEALDAAVRGRAEAIRAASRKRYGVPREEIEASFSPTRDDTSGAAGPVGRKRT